MRELTSMEVASVSGAGILLDGSGLAASIVTENPLSTPIAALKVGNDITQNYLSEQQRMGIGYTTYQMLNHPINSIENAVSYWL